MHDCWCETPRPSRRWRNRVWVCHRCWGLWTVIRAGVSTDHPFWQWVEVPMSVPVIPPKEWVIHV